MNITNRKFLFLLLTLNIILSSFASVIPKNEVQHRVNENFGSSKLSLDSSPENSLQRPTRAKRDIPAMIKSFDDRLFGVESQMARSSSTIEDLGGFLRAIGFLLESTDFQIINPCKENSSRINENDWTLIGTSTCVKIIHGLHTYDEAVELCRNEVQIGQDITYPEVLQLDSEAKRDAILDLLRAHKNVPGVWVDIISNRESPFGSISPTETRHECVELRNGGQGVREGSGFIPWVKVSCIRTNSVVCEKTLPVPYAEIARKYLDQVKTEKQMDINAYHENVALKKQLDELKSWKQLREEKITTDSEQTEFLVSQVKNLRAENIARKDDQAKLQEQVEDLKNQISGLQVWKQTISDHVAAESLKNKQIEEQVEDLAKKSVSSKTQVDSLRRKTQQLESWKTKLMNTQFTSNSTTTDKSFQDLFRKFVSSRN